MKNLSHDLKVAAKVDDKAFEIDKKKSFKKLTKHIKNQTPLPRKEQFAL